MPSAPRSARRSIPTGRNPTFVYARTELPNAVVEAHGVHPRDATRVEVVLQGALATRIGPDDRETVRCLGSRHLPALQEELPCGHPFEDHPSARVGGRNVRKRRLDAPLTDERVERGPFRRS